MKTTGIVRGIDSLGRIVLPKELRTNMHIDKDSKLEIFVEAIRSSSKSTVPPAAAISAASWRPTWPSMRVTASARLPGQDRCAVMRCKRKRRIT